MRAISPTGAIPYRRANSVTRSTTGCRRGVRMSHSPSPFEKIHLRARRIVRTRCYAPVFASLTCESIVIGM